MTTPFDGLPALLTPHLVGRLQGPAVLQPLPDKGLAHWHVRLKGTGLLARIPKQSQMVLAAQENLLYQSGCFRRAASSGHVPLRDEPDPLAGLAALIDAQARYLDHPAVPAESARVLKARLRGLTPRMAPAVTPCPQRLITFDAHPGNCLITSTTWDREASFELSTEAVARAYQTWAESARPLDRRADGEGGSAQHSEAALIAHVRDRVNDCLAPRTIERMLAEFQALRAWLAG